MAKRSTSQEMRVMVTDWKSEEAPSDEPRYAISVVASRCGVHTRTLHRYEEWGLLEPTRSGRGRLYSEADIDRIMRVRRLVDDLGLNLAGAAAVLHMRQQVISLQRELDALRDALDGAAPSVTLSRDRRG
jgi:MerR family transcriptional regulator/heat shock protein HspR